jgi:quinol monooxygenase YgiN
LSRTIEIGRFSVKPGEEEEFLAERAAMAEAARAQFEGLLGESLLRLEDGSYMTIWSGRSASSVTSPSRR